MHRDVKPQNVLADCNKNKLTLIDWGLAEYYKPHTAYNVRVAARGYKAPELLLGYEYYDYAVDIWSVGCIFAGLLLQQDGLFSDKENGEQLVKIAQLLGTDELYAYIEKLGITLPTALCEQLGK